MEKELEVKILNIVKDEIQKKLSNVGASLIKREEQINYLLDSKDNSIQCKNNSYLRLRETKDLDTDQIKYTLTLKENVSKDGIRENIEISSDIEDKKALLYIMKVLGYDVIQKGFKERISYIYDEIRFDIDTWDESTYPYTYMEIEVKSQDDLIKAIKLLNIDEKNISTKSIVDLRKDLGLTT
ncbi:class IV adenylate cyclase [Sporanaerobacter acetigenes]|uniref:class IV adenylate cyclase n=1 Tax=Sporanaerobacter acetigenes TaxID=165813 RepID=UPI00332FE95C